MDDRGRFKTALRGGELCEADLYDRLTYNELALLRASYFVVNGGKDAKYEPFIYRTIAQLEEEHASAEEAKEIRDSVFDFLDMTETFGLPEALE